MCVVCYNTSEHEKGEHTSLLIGNKGYEDIFSSVGKRASFCLASGIRHESRTRSSLINRLRSDNAVRRDGKLKQTRRHDRKAITRFNRTKHILHLYILCASFFCFSSYKTVCLFAKRTVQIVSDCPQSNSDTSKLCLCQVVYTVKIDEKNVLPTPRWIFS